MTKRSILILTLAAALFAARPCTADESEGRFLQSEFIPIGARYLGMGGGHVALPGGASSAYYNPALLPWEKTLEFVLEGTYIDDPTFTDHDGETQLKFHERGEFGLVGMRLPDTGGFSFTLLEVTRYDHDIRGFLFGSPPAGGGDKPTGAGKTAAETEETIRDYQDRVSIHSFGIATGYKGSANTSFGISFWVDRKKMFKKIDYVTSCTDITDEQVNNGWYDVEGTTNDISLRFSAGIYHRLSDRMDGGLVVNSGTDLTSVLQVDQWTTCAPAERRPTVHDETPFTIQAGIAYYIARDLRFAVDGTFQNWGSIEGRYKSVVQAGTGVEWDRTERLALRGGFYTSFDPADLGDGEYAEALREIRRSGNMLNADEYFLTAGFGYWLSPTLLIDGAVANSDLLSPEDGRTTAAVAIRFILDPTEEKEAW